MSRVNLAYREYLDDNVALADELLDGCPGDLRGWEWAYARRLGHAELRSWTASSRGLDVWCVAFAPDGARIAAGTGHWGEVGNAPTGELVVRDVHSGGEAFALRGLPGAFQAVAYSPDGRTLAAARGFQGKEPGAVLVALDAGSGRELWRADERGAQVLGLAYSPDGRSIASGCGHFNSYDNSGYVRLRDARTGGELGRPWPAVPAACWRWPMPPTAASSRWPAARWSISATSPNRAAPSPDGWAGTSTSSTPSPTARTADGSPPAGGTRRSASGIARVDG